MPLALQLIHILFAVQTLHGSTGGYREAILTWIKNTHSGALSVDWPPYSPDLSIIEGVWDTFY